MISGRTRERTVDEVLEVLKDAGVPAGKIFGDMMEDPYYAARENVVTVEDPKIRIRPFPMQNVVSRLKQTPGRVCWTGPAFGRHNDEVYGEVLGLSEEEREALRERGVIRCA